MGFRNVVNDGSSDQSRLRLQVRAAATADLDAGDLGPFLDRVVGAGFSGFEANCPNEQEADAQAAMLRERGLAIGYSAAAAEADDLLNPLELAHRMRAGYLSVRAAGSLKSSPEIAEILEEMYELVNDAGLPLFIETRSGSVTQDLRRTVKVVNRFKKVRFTGDFSGYLAACELGAEWSEDVWDHFRQIARRCGNWRGRLDAGESVSAALIQQVQKLWTLGMGEWLDRARLGDVLPFCCEAGAGGWEQCLAIKSLAEGAWAQAKIERQPKIEVTVEPITIVEIAENQGMH